MPTKGDVRFGRLAIERDCLSEKILKIYLVKLKKLEERGQRSTIDRLLLADRLLSLGQITGIQKVQERRIQFCPDCGARHNVFTLPAGEKVRCNKCDERFEVEDWSDAEAPRSTVVHISASATRSAGSSAELASLTGTELAGADEGAPEDFVFGCPECGADLRLEDEYCPRCHEHSDTTLQNIS